MGKGGTVQNEGRVNPVAPRPTVCKGPGPSGNSKGSRPNNEKLGAGDERFYDSGFNPGDGRKIDVSGTTEVSGSVPETRQSGVQDPAQKARG